MPRVYKKVEKKYTREMVKVALQEIENGSSIRKACKTYNISFGYLQKMAKLQKENKLVFAESMRGKKTYLEPALEQKFSEVLKRMEAMGLGPTLGEFRCIVQDYLNENEIKTKFENNLPGYEWTKLFFSRHQLKLKKGTQMNVARKKVSSDPFIIYGFYKLLEDKMKELGIENRPECIYNLDETCFSLDPTKKSIIGTVGQKTIRLTCGTNRENITVLACCCANGTVMDPLIVYKGKRMLDSWVGTGPDMLNGIMYCLSDSGWMTTKVFETFLENLVIHTKGTRPLLIIMDGHLSHTSIKTIELAMSENITLLKLPSHCTDLLQPLDVSCFSPLKMHYDTEITDYVHRTSANAPLRRPAFANIVCKVWRKGLSEANIISGFKTTGIFPLDSTVYNVSRLDPLKLKTYEIWKQKGCPLTPDGDADLTDVVQVEDDVVEGVSEKRVEESIGTLINLHSISTPVSQHRMTTPLPAEAQMASQGPSNVPRTLSVNWTIILKEAPLKDLLAEVARRCSSSTEKKSVEEVLHARGREAEPKPKSRRAILTKSIILTQTECLEKMKEKELAKSTKNTKRGRPKLSLVARSNKKRKTEEQETSDSESDISMTEASSDTTIENFDSSELEPEENRADKKDLQQPKITDESVNKYYAVYYNDPKPTYFWGKATKVFSHDVEDPITKVEMSFLKKKTIGSDPRDWSWKDGSEVEIVNTKFIFYGPEIPTIRKNTLYFNDLECFKHFEKIKT